MRSFPFYALPRHFSWAPLCLAAASLLLVSLEAFAQIRDGNLIEYGTSGFGGTSESLWLHPPPVKIFRDGRVLVIDHSGARQGQIDSGRIDELERDLARMPLLQKTALVEFPGRRPIHGGGISYLRFRDGDQEVIVAAPGMPVDAGWEAILDRVNVERASASAPFRPEQLRFHPWKWVPGLKTQTIAWPFTCTLPLAGRDSQQITTSDPGVIALVIAHAYDSKLFSIPVEENGVQNGFIVEGAPGWMEPEYLQTRLLEMWTDGRHGRGEGTDDGNLIEYGKGGFASGDSESSGPMLYPPEVKIYSDGRIVFGDKNGYRQGIVDPKRLARLERDLVNDPLLKKSRILHVRNGGLISLHGGMAYIRYRNADNEVIVAVLSHPRRGPYVRVLNRIRREIPTSHASFRPKEIAFRVSPGSAWNEPVEWPFSNVLLHSRSEPLTTTDPAVIAFVLDHSFGGYSWMQTNVRESGKEYALILESAPDWYDPDVLSLTLGNLRLTGSSEDAQP